MKSRHTISEQDLSPLFEESAEAWRRQDYVRSIKLLERAKRISPGDPLILLNLGQAYGMRYNRTAASTCFEKAIQASPRKVNILLTAARCCREFGSFEMAEQYLKRAVDANEDHVEAVVELAEIFERRNRLDEARDMVNRALHRDGNCAKALLMRARFARLSGELGEAESLLRKLVSKVEMVQWTRVCSWYELGAVLDRQMRYDEAMAAFQEAKRILSFEAERHKADLHSVRKRVKDFEINLTAEQLERWQDSGKKLQPAHSIAFLGGHPRSGTTLLEQVLDSHPQIIAAEETHVFHDEAYLPLTRNFSQATILSILESTPVGALREMRARYFRFMEMFLGNPIGSRLLIDKNPSLTVLLPAFLRLFPEIKVLVALRDPRDVCLSCFMQPLPLNSVSAGYLTMEDTVSEYVSVMGLWHSVAPKMRTSYLEVRYEDLVRNLENTSRRVLDFLGIGWDENVMHFDQHARQKLILSPTYSEVIRPVSSNAIGRWRNYHKYIEPYFAKLKPFISDWHYD